MMVAQMPTIRTTLTLQTRETASVDLGRFGSAVGDRLGNKLRNNEREDFCVRHLVLALATEPGLPYPTRLSMLEQDQAAVWPDCLVWWEATEPAIGLEVTQATSAAWQKSLTQDERDLVKGDAKPEDVVFVSASEDGWAGDAPEEETAALIADAIARKLEGLNSTPAKYRGTSQCDLLVYADDAPVIATGVNRNDGDSPLKTLSACFIRGIGQHWTVFVEGFVESTS